MAESTSVEYRVCEGYGPLWRPRWKAALIYLWQDIHWIVPPHWWVRTYPLGRAVLLWSYALRPRLGGCWVPCRKPLTHRIAGDTLSAALYWTHEVVIPHSRIHDAHTPARRSYRVLKKPIKDVQRDHSTAELTIAQSRLLAGAFLRPCRTSHTAEPWWTRIWALEPGQFHCAASAARRSCCMGLCYWLT